MLIPGRDCQLSELDLAVVALKHDWAGRAFVAVERSAGDAGDDLAVDDLLAVKCDGDHPSDQAYLERLPLARFFRSVFDRRQKTVDTADVVTFRLFAEVIFDLHLIAATQVDSAIAAAGIAEIRTQFEVGELLLGQEVVAGLCVDQNAVSNDPAILLAGCPRHPARQIPAVEKLDRLAPSRQGGPPERGGDDIPAGFMRQRLFVGRLAAEHVAFERTLDVLEESVRFSPLGRQREMDAALLEFHAPIGRAACRFAHE